MSEVVESRWVELGLRAFVVNSIRWFRFLVFVSWWCEFLFDPGRDLGLSSSSPIWKCLPLCIRRKVNDVVCLATEHLSTYRDSLPASVDYLFVEHFISAPVAHAPAALQIPVSCLMAVDKHDDE